MPDGVAEVAQEEQIAKSIVNYNRDDARARYLGLRSSGFGIRESLRLIGKAQSTLSAWRHDEEFADLENRIPEFRKTLAIEYAGLEFLRNYRLILEKDYRVIKASMEVTKDDAGKIVSLPMPSQDHQYLLKLRTHYTPQQLQIIEALIAGESAPGEFNFTNMVIEMSRTQERVRIETRNRSEPELSPIEVDNG